MKNFLSKLFAVHVEHNRWQTTSVSTPLPTYTITVSSCISLIVTFLFHIKIATQFSVPPVTTSFICNLYQSGPFRLSNAFCKSMKQAHNSSSVHTICCGITLSILLLLFTQTHLLHVYPQSSNNPFFLISSLLSLHYVSRH